MDGLAYIFVAGKSIRTDPLCTLYTCPRQNLLLAAFFWNLLISYICIRRPGRLYCIKRTIDKRRKKKHVFDADFSWEDTGVWRWSEKIIIIIYIQINMFLLPDIVSCIVFAGRKNVDVLPTYINDLCRIRFLPESRLFFFSTTTHRDICRRSRDCRGVEHFDKPILLQFSLSDIITLVYFDFF